LYRFALLRYWSCAEQSAYCAGCIPLDAPSFALEAVCDAALLVILLAIEDGSQTVVVEGCPDRETASVQFTIQSDQAGITRMQREATRVQTTLQSLGGTLEMGPGPFHRGGEYEHWQVTIHLPVEEGPE
jgi:hypothetical protein